MDTMPGMDAGPVQLDSAEIIRELSSQQGVSADGRFDPVCRVCGDPLTTEELVCDNCHRSA
jgi:hypothetical protein